jgi:2-amino-4-hydroxy-6-hydroxymethyldihydropteridine diphosphokinase
VSAAGSGSGWARRVGYLGLGSNVGDRLANLQAAVEALRGVEVEVVASSSVYETEPVGEVLDQRSFFNACVRVSVPTSMEPLHLLDVCKRVELDLGRAPGGVRHGPRPIDVDVLLLSDVVFAHERLTLPHPEVVSRRFVLVPLLELDPRLTLPDGTVLADALAALPPEGQEVVRVAWPLALPGAATPR